MTVGFTLYPAIDVRDGRVVRLRQGDYAQETRYDDPPLALAQRYEAQGATWLHLVDLDAARAGGYTLAPLLRDLRTHTSLRIQTGGGVRGAGDVEAILEAGAERVVVGSVAVRNIDTVLGWFDTFGREHLTIALDAREDEAGTWQLPVAGWTEASGVDLYAVLARYTDKGLRHLLCTDIARDGMLSGPNLRLYRELARVAPQACVQASGGVRDISDILDARASGCAGAVLGKALLDGCFQLDDAIAQAAEGLPC